MKKRYKHLGWIGRKSISLIFCLLHTFFSEAQISVSTTDATDCKKSDGKATITVTTTVTGLSLEYSIDGGSFYSSNSFINISSGDHIANVREKKSQCLFSKKFTIKEVQNALKVNISGLGSTEFCDNANPPKVILTANASGGSGIYDYTWPGGSITVSSSGRQSVTVTDKQSGCTASLGGDVIFVPIVCSRDPNDIIGPQGFGPSKMIAKLKLQSYMIRFENDPNFATAPAQIVKINHPLDSNVNPFSLRLGDFGFGGLTFTVPPDKTFYSTRLDVINSLGVVVDVTAGIDAVKKEAFWIFEAKDPNTGLPPTTANLGFLPVNDSTSKGEGYVTYFIKAANSTKTGDVIHAKASIVFDANSAIETPEITNVIDAVAPTSHVKALPTSSAVATIDLSWEGQDDTGGSGVRDYDLYVSENDGLFTSYQTGLTSTSTKFTGTLGNTYRFYTLANDNVGNQEEPPTTPDAEVKLGIAPDLTPLVYMRPISVYGTSIITMVVDVIELKGVATNGPITVKLTKDTKVALTFPSSATSIDNRSVQNSVWSLDDTNPDYYILTTTQSIEGGGMLSFGLMGKLTPDATTGIMTGSAVILGSGIGEERVTNNVDADKVEYFP